MWDHISLSGHPHLAMPTYVIWLPVKHRDGSVVETDKTPRAKESNGHLVSPGWFKYVWKKRIADENVRLSNCLWMFLCKIILSIFLPYLPVWQGWTVCLAQVSNTWCISASVCCQTYSVLFLNCPSHNCAPTFTSLMKCETALVSKIP